MTRHPLYFQGKVILNFSVLFNPSDWNKWSLPLSAQVSWPRCRVCLQNSAINHLTIANHTPINHKKISFSPALLLPLALAPLSTSPLSALSSAGEYNGRKLPRNDVTPNLPIVIIFMIKVHIVNYLLHSAGLIMWAHYPKIGTFLS